MALSSQMVMIRQRPSVDSMSGVEMGSVTSLATADTTEAMAESASWAPVGKSASMPDRQVGRPPTWQGRLRSSFQRLLCVVRSVERSLVLNFFGVVRTFLRLPQCLVAWG
eukprot:3111370-Pyramimonas_sp.AAC.2